ncbi:unnamed protein product [Miscanthus lutarioriparius]|uniref:RING-type domain-containing protein n=1 Tax=Miscanthus lutarioriparius TaxID=422564 RepID=A0A811QD71_9POAL|nr:unnamed protein product [Miscanthus lutarioriparius]
MTLIYGCLLYIAVSELAACFRLWRSATAAEWILDSVPDVPYLPLPDQQAASSCVICIAEYGSGEGRFVMPGCGDAFHRGCIAEWLRQGKTTCPMCRATAIVVVPPAGEEKVVAAAVSTAEDMVEYGIIVSDTFGIGQLGKQNLI